MPPNATVVPTQNYNRGIEMLEHGEIDTYATNKPTLFEMSDQMSGARILEGRWGEEHLAVAIPKGNEAVLDYVRHFDCRKNREHLKEAGVVVPINFINLRLF